MALTEKTYVCNPLAVIEFDKGLGVVMNRKIQIGTLKVVFFLLSFDVIAECVEKYDLNSDGIIDRWEYYENKELVRLEEDRNVDGKIDFVTEFYSKSQPYKITKQDTTYDGKFNRKQEYRGTQEGKIKILTSVDKDGDGVYEIEYLNIVDADQK